MSLKPAADTATAPSAARFAVQCEVLRLSAQPSGPVLLVQFLLDCGVAALFAWQYSVPHALAWIALIAASTAWRGFFPQQLPDPLTADNLPAALRLHTLRIAVHEGVHGLAGVLLFNPAEPVAQLLLAAVIMAMTLSSAFSVSYHTPAMQLAIALLLLPLIVMGVLFGAPVMMMAALLGVGLLAMVWKLVSERSRQLEENIGLRHNESALREQALAGLHASQQAQAERLRFFSAANHDLRQPVMAIGLQAEVLRQQLDGGAPTVLVQQTVAALSQAQQALEGLTNQLLEIGRIEAAADPLHPTPVALAPLLQSFARQSSRVRVRCPADALAWTDAVALRRILGNLVDNALKFAPQGRVLLAVRRRRAGAAWRVEVRDGGIGIAPEAQQRVFGDFEQVGNVERNLRRGHGLGLAIVRRLADRLGFVITLRSVPGRGAVFGFELEAAPADLVLPEAIREAVPVPADPQPLRPGIAVLVVEDNTVVADSIAALLRHWQAEPRIYTSAAEALALADLPAIDVALCDIRLPGELDGVALAELLHEQRPDLTIALVSADIEPVTQRLAQQRGWHALRKPVRAADLRAVLAAAGQGLLRP
ncbi:hybrid sensor histidine kinase/response regulator [Variovorax sp. J22G21]|uniref:ATP-binding response regulator n=1 Tax=Variovorax fucosicus TaxID=3053517 RepID=UPI0025765CA1|nr:MULTISPECIES: hybrid sensor histidine kinase/response regulator [unclassified Variovorax]MDM0039645.1 hybrid sensor histidine kinase/response regulator [Variovorax sp. J22R193]MDM0064420.1 hybrid sensor histidine kinase/response regulator [Variovorax sp. J22G21]